MSHLLFVVSGPAGSGKTSLVRHIVTQHRDLRRVVTTTTREPRPGEIDGADYHFKSRSEFERLIQKGAFVEHAEYNNNFYGLTKKELEERVEHGDAIAILEIQGAKAIREAGIPHKSIFILPPSIDELRARLEGRDSDTTESIANRLKIAEGELALAQTYDFQVVNDEFDRTAAKIWKFIRAEGNEGIGDFDELRYTALEVHAGANVFPLCVPHAEWWNGPHLSFEVEPEYRLCRWLPGYIERGGPDCELYIVVGEQPDPAEDPIYGEIVIGDNERASFEDTDWSSLERGKYVEIGVFNTPTGDERMVIRTHVEPKPTQDCLFPELPGLPDSIQKAP